MQARGTVSARMPARPKLTIAKAIEQVFDSRAIGVRLAVKGCDRLQRDLRIERQQPLHTVSPFVNTTAKPTDGRLQSQGRGRIRPIGQRLLDCCECSVEVAGKEV